MWSAIMVAERDNVVAALHFAAGRGDADTAVRLTAALCMFWTVRGARAESVTWLELALDVPGESPPDARAMVRAIHMINKATTGGYERLEEIIGPFRAVVAEAERFPSHPMLALLEPLLGLFTDDLRLGLSSIDRRLSHPDPWTRAVLWMIRASMLENEGDMAGMREVMPVAVEGFRATGERFGLAQALSSLADAHLAFGDPERAIEALKEAIATLREFDAEDTADHERTYLAIAWLQQGHVDRARAELQDLTRTRDHTAHSVAFAWIALGDIARYEDDLDEAARQYEVATNAIESAPFTSPQFRALALTAKAHLSLAGNDPATADKQIESAVEWTMEAKDMPVLGRVAVAAASLWLHRGNPFEAAKTLGAAEQLRGAPDGRAPDVVRLVSGLRAELGDAEYDAAYAQGLGLDRAEAIDQVRRR
jgi:tetratricopeptide (TPR) repeat protein